MHASQQTINTNNALHAKVNALKSTLPKFHVGDKVRIVRKKGTFEKGFTPNWTDEVFTITAAKATKPPTYTIEDTLGEPVQGTRLRTRASAECAGNLPYLASAQWEGGGIECLSSGKVTAVRSIRGYH